MSTSSEPFVSVVAAQPQRLAVLRADHEALGAPTNAAELLLEHGKIREVLASLDVTVDLHLVRADVLEAFLATPGAHAAREDAGLYKWAAQQGAT